MSLTENSSADSPPPTEAATTPKRTLGQLLESLTAIEKIMDSEDFDIDAIVGDIKLERDALAAKVDSIDYVVREFEAYAARTKARADNMLRRSNTAKKRAAGLMENVRLKMKLHGFEKLTGNERVIEYVVWHTPSLDFTRKATADDLLAFGENLVEVVPRSYEWKKVPFKEAILSEQIKIESVPFAKLTYGEKIVFDDRDRPDVTPTKKGKKK